MRLSLEPRQRTPAWLNLLLPVMAVLATLVLTSGLIAAAGAEVMPAYGALFAGAFGSTFNSVETVVKAAPLVFTGLAVAVAFRAKFWNIGAEGQLLAGAMAAAFVGGLEGLPAWALAPLMILGGAIAGGLWASVPATLKVRYQVDDVARNFINERGYGEYFFHRTGHNIGLEVHGNGAHMDNFETRDEREVLPFTAFSIEPGVYLDDFGIRSEINMLLTEGKAEVTGEPIQREVLCLIEDD